MPDAPAAVFASIIIPALNEAAGIAAAIRSTCCAFIAHEVLVVDAGSSDDTVGIAEDEGARVIHSDRRQRAAQMNLGAKEACGEVLLFLHADTRLGSGALLAIRDGLRDPRVIGGAFFRRYDSASRVLAATCRLADWRNRHFGWHLGDQAMFVRGHVFQRCGPFAEAGQFEDLDLSRRMAHCGRLVTLRPPVLSAARRFAKDGAVVRTVKDLLLTCQYLVQGLPRLAPAPADPAAPLPEPLVRARQ